MMKYVGAHVVKDNVELEKLLKEGYSHITEQGYAISDDEDISDDDMIIEDTLCCLYDSMEDRLINPNYNSVQLYSKEE